jgi:hypothetical protein
MTDTHRPPVSRRGPLATTALVLGIACMVVFLAATLAALIAGGAIVGNLTGTTPTPDPAVTECIGEEPC